MKTNKTFTGFLDFSVVAFIVFILMLMLFWGCKHDPMLPVPTPTSDTTNGTNDSSVYNETPCSPDSVYFNNSILPLFVSNCAKSGCHDAATHANGVVLDNYANIISTGEIVSGNPSHGKITEVISSSEPDDRMPPAPNTPLTTAQTNMISAWINQGALNNSCNGCDTVSVTYSGTVAPLLLAKCTGCHSGTNPSGNISLSNYQDVKVQALNGRLMGSISHNAGYSAMPKGSQKLPQCEIDRVNLWITEGALQN